MKSWDQRPLLQSSRTKPTPTVDAPTAPHKEVGRTISTRDLDGMRYDTAFPERAIDVTKNFSSIESQGLDIVVPLLSCLPQQKRETKTKQQRLRTIRKSVSYRCLTLLTIPMPLGLGS